MGDILFHSTFPPHQIEREREVILDEINSYYDSPSELIDDDIENLLYTGHELGHYILGEPEILQSFNRERIHRFMARQYHPRKWCFSLLEKRLLRKWFIRWKSIFP